jgi:hypothetical protein
VYEALSCCYTQVGADVEVVSDDERNGVKGQIEAADAAAGGVGRWLVRVVKGGPLISVKPQNLRVRFCGLTQVSSVLKNNTLLMPSASDGILLTTGNLRDVSLDSSYMTGLSIRYRKAAYTSSLRPHTLVAQGLTH